jgi:hypothetical protein
LQYGDFGPFFQKKNPFCRICNAFFCSPSGKKITLKREKKSAWEGLYLE